MYIFVVLVLFVFHNWAHPDGISLEGGFFLKGLPDKHS
jgi:hypothetical protein